MTGLKIYAQNDGRKPCDVSQRRENLDFSCFNWFWSKHIYASHILHQQQMWKNQQTYIIHTCSTVLYRSIPKWTMPWHYQPSRMSVQDSTAMARAMTSLKQPPSCTVWSGDVGCWVWEASWVSAQIMSEVAAMKKRDAACRCAGPWQNLANHGQYHTVPHIWWFIIVFPHVNVDFEVSTTFRQVTRPWNGLLEARDAGEDHQRLEKGQVGKDGSAAILQGLISDSISLTGLLQVIGES